MCHRVRNYDLRVEVNISQHLCFIDLEIRLTDMSVDAAVVARISLFGHEEFSMEEIYRIFAKVAYVTQFN